MKKDLIDKYFKNQCTQEELRIVLKYLEEDNFSDKKNILKQVWDDIEDEDTEGLGLILDKIHDKINIENNNNSLRKICFKTVLNYLVKVAAVLFIPLFLFVSYQVLNKNNEIPNLTITSQFGARTNFELPDGSVVFLNNDSSLTFPNKFNRRNREVILKGEAYFDVIHNPDIPLLVKVDDITVKVLGTQFNIKSYKDDDDISVTLKTGEIEFIPKDINTPNNKLLLKPNQQIVYSKKTNSLIYNEVEADKYIAWTRGKLVFVNDDLENIIKKLSRWYSVDININDDNLLKYKLTASFQNESILRIMELISLAIPIDYEVNKSVIKSDGNYSKVEINIKTKIN
ncbi:FecR domain-containing protein [Flavicella sp.]|uniref:FecR family protein n=1 Tax=Flavicella sp. TaxID=2957742 RepID=UPI003019EDDF